MAKTYYRQLTAILRDNGFHLERYGKGAHEIWTTKNTGRFVVVDRGVTIRHTANGILKDAGLPKAF